MLLQGTNVRLLCPAVVRFAPLLLNTVKADTHVTALLLLLPILPGRRTERTKPVDCKKTGDHYPGLPSPRPVILRKRMT